MSVRTCAVCTAPANKRCSGCKHVYYCSKQCQSNHWKEHKKECKLSKNGTVRYGIAHLYISFVFSIVPLQEIFPLVALVFGYGVTAKEIHYLFVYAIVRLSVQKGFTHIITDVNPNIASAAVPIALNYKSQQPYSNPSIASFRSLYFVYNFVIVAAVSIQWTYLNWEDSTSDKNTNDSSSVKVKRLHGIIVMFALGIMFDVCNCVIFFFKYVRHSSVARSFVFICYIFGLMFALLLCGSWLFGADYPDYNLFLYCLWELNSKECILCTTMLCVYMSFVYFFGDNFWRINMFSWFKSEMIYGVSWTVIGVMFYHAGWSYHAILYALYIMYRNYETKKYVRTRLC